MLIAQTVKWGKAIPSTSTNLFKIIHSSKYIYCIYERMPGFHTDSIRVLRYNKNLDLDKRLAFKETYNTKMASAEIMGEDLYLFFEDYSKGTTDEIQEHYYCKIKGETFEVSAPVVMATLPTAYQTIVWDFFSKSSGLSGYREYSKFNLGLTQMLSSFSNNKQYFGVAADIAEKNKKETLQKLQLILYDSTMNEKWRTMPTLNYERNLFRLEGHAIDDLGRVYILAKVYFNKEKEAVKDKTNYKYIVMVYKNATDAPMTYDIYEEDMFLLDPSLVLTTKNEVMFVACYSKGDAGLQGLYCLKLDTDLKIIGKVNQSPFSPKLVEKLGNERAVKKNRGISAEYYLTSLVKKADGGLKYILERKWQNTLGKSLPLYQTDEVVVNDISSTGELKWSYALEKRQHYTERQPLSFGGISINGNLSLLFNIHAKAYTKNKEYRYEPTNLSFMNSEIWLQLQEVDASGKAKGKKLINLDTKKQQLPLVNINSEAFNNELIVPIYSYKDNTVSLVKITF
jgi:hypothetical protein